MMTWGYTMNMSGLTTGDLQGQDSWTGDTNYDIATNNPLTPATKNLFTNGSMAGPVVRTITGVTEFDNLYLAFAREGNTTGANQSTLIFKLRDSGVLQLTYVGLYDKNNSIKVRAATGEGEQIIVDSVDLGTYYYVHMQFNTLGDGKYRFRAATEGDTSWGSFTSWFTKTDASFNGTVANIAFDGGGEGVDASCGLLSATDPFAAATSIKTIDGLAKASVKTVNGLAIASVKTYNGLA